MFVAPEHPAPGQAWLGGPATSEGRLKTLAGPSNLRNGTLVFILSGSLTLQAIASTACAAPVMKRPDQADPVAAVRQACQSKRFDLFLRHYAQSAVVQARFTADFVRVVASRDAPTVMTPKRDYLRRLPIASRGWNYIAPARLAYGRTPQYLLVRTRSLGLGAWRADWVEARFPAQPAHGKWIRAPIEIGETSGRLTFTVADDGCWRLTEDVAAPSDTPFTPGKTPLRCWVRDDDHRLALAMVERGIRARPGDMELGQDLAACVELLDRIERQIKTQPRLRAMRNAIDARLAFLARRQTPQARAALARDESKFRRSTAIGQHALAGDATEGGDDLVELEARLGARLAQLALIAPSRQGYVGRWRNASGELDLHRRPDGYGIDANPVDIDFLAWTCEVEMRLDRTKDGLDGEEDGEILKARKRGGVLIVEHRSTAGSFIKSCGASGSISGIYFPSRVSRARPPG